MNIRSILVSNISKTILFSFCKQRGIYNKAIGYAFIE